jgi:hypothetical protein
VGSGDSRVKEKVAMLPVAYTFVGTRHWGFGETVFAVFVALVGLPLLAIVIIVLVKGYPPADVVRATFAHEPTTDARAL